MAQSDNLFDLADIFRPTLEAIFTRRMGGVRLGDSDAHWRDPGRWISLSGWLRNACLENQKDMEPFTLFIQEGEWRSDGLGSYRESCLCGAREPNDLILTHEGAIGHFSYLPPAPVKTDEGWIADGSDERSFSAVIFLPERQFTQIDRLLEREFGKEQTVVIKFDLASQIRGFVDRGPDNPWEHTKALYHFEPNPDSRWEAALMSIDFSTKRQEFWPLFGPCEPNPKENVDYYVEAILEKTECHQTLKMPFWECLWPDRLRNGTGRGRQWQAGRNHLSRATGILPRPASGRG
jgi:hypothetical protein